MLFKVWKNQDFPDDFWGIIQDFQEVQYFQKQEKDFHY